jgi:ribose transport system ATP-binding protein
MDDIILRIKGLSKSFSSTNAVVDVNMIFSKGKIHGLIGENGSGKSTLSNMIAGVISPDTGEMIFEGRRYKPLNSAEAANSGVSMITQEMGTIAGMTIAENIFLGRESLFTGKGGLVNTGKMNGQAAEIFRKIGILHIDPRKPVTSLSFEDRKIVEIARAMYTDPCLLIIDETTTALSQTGRNILYSIMEQMKLNDKTVIFISHDLEEVRKHCDLLSVMRDGHYIDTLEVSNCTDAQIRELMVGRRIDGSWYRVDETASYGNNVVLSCLQINTPLLHDVSCELHESEILGIAGLTDSGMHDFGKVLFGLTKPQTGIVTTSCKGQKKEIKNPGSAIKLKIGYVSKNRDEEALMLLSSIKENIVLPSLDMLASHSFILPVKEKRLAQSGAEAMQIKMRDIDQYVMYLSGGNKQKVVLAKWLCNKSQILILDCPTRGIDIGVKEAIYQLMKNLKEEGKSIVLISEELPEVIGMSDRILVFKDGKINAEFKRKKNLAQTEVVKYMI